jgi:hypothetical protein
MGAPKAAATVDLGFIDVCDDPELLHPVSSTEFLPTHPTCRHPTRRFEGTDV